MGKTIDLIAEIMFPGMDLEKSVKILTECCDEEQIYLRKNGGILYPNLEDTLKLLAQKYSLYIVSNCKYGYVGETTGDLEGANYADIPFIYVQSGFGQLDDVKY